MPFSLVGSFWLLYLLNYNTSIAVWVGIIALAGLEAETGLVMLLYLELAYKEWKDKGKLNSLEDLKEAIMHGAVKRIRPKIMTVSVILAAASKPGRIGCPLTASLQSICRTAFGM